MTKTKQEYSYNFDVVGSPTITDQGVASGFSSSNYLTLGTFNPSSSSWEVAVKFTTSDNLSTEQIVFNNLVSYCGAAIYVEGGKLWTQFTGSTSSINIGSHTLNGISQNKTYWVKIIHDSTQTKYTSSYSEDGQTWVEFGSTTSSNTITGGTGGIGIDHDGAGAFLGSIDLTECYININGQRWWDALTTTTFYGDTYQVRKGLPYQVRVRADGKWDFTGNQTFTTAGQEYFATMETYDGLSMDYIESYQSADKLDFSNTVLPWKWQYSTALSTNRYCLMPQGQNYENVVEQFEGYVTDYTVVGSPTISSEYVVSGFSSSNYLQASGERTYTAGEINSFEIIYHVITGNSLQSSGRIYQPSDSGISDSTLAPTIVAEPSEGIYLWFHTTSEPVCRAVSSVATNTEYWLKWIYDGTDIKGYYSNDGGLTWTLNATVTSFTPYWNYKDFKVGNRSGDVTVFNGSIDLKNSYIKINGDMWWIGAEFTKRAKQQIVSSITKVGSPTISSDFVASGFSSSNYFTVSSVSEDINQYIIYVKFNRLQNSSSSSQVILWASLDVHKYGTTILAYNGSTDVTLFTASADTDYYVKGIYNGTSRTIYYSTDGSNYTQVLSDAYNPHLYMAGIGYASFGNAFGGSIDLKGLYVTDLQGNVIWRAVDAVKETLPGCTYNFEDDGSATTLNCFAVNGDESVVLTPDNSYGTSRLLGTVSIPSHTVYEYDNGTWTEVE